MNEILIYGDIGFEVQARDVVDQLSGMTGPLTVRVDSFGGDVYAGISILNALRRYPDQVTVFVDGMAASAASFIAVGGGDKLVMSPNSSLMVHGAWSQGVGNSEELAQLSADLDQITVNMATIYAEKSGRDSSYWRELMAKDTTFTAEQAVEAGLADEVAESRLSARAEKARLVMASKRNRFAARTGGVPVIVDRAAGPPSTDSPSDGQEGDAVSVLEKLAQELGREPEDVQNALSGFFDDVKPVEPTEEPEVSEEAQAAEVEEPETTEANETEVEEESEGEQTAEATEAEETDSVTLDRETYNDLRVAAQMGWKAMEAEKVAKLDAEVDGWVADGRIAAALRSKAVKAIRKDAELARDLYGSNPKGTVPRAELGHGSDPSAKENDVPSVDDLRALSESRRKSGQK